MDSDGVCVARAETDDDMLYVVHRHDLASTHSKTERVSVAVSTTKEAEIVDTHHPQFSLMRTNEVRMVFSMGAKGFSDTTKPVLSQDKANIAVLVFPEKIEPSFGLLEVESGVEREEKYDSASEEEEEHYHPAHLYDSSQDSSSEEREEHYHPAHLYASSRESSSGSDPSSQQYSEPENEDIYFFSGKDKVRGEQEPVGGQDEVQGAARKRYTKQERLAFGKLMHDRMHIGHSSNVMNAMRKAYGEAYTECKDPCDACMYSKARMHTRSKTHTRAAAHLGDRLHYDVFHGPATRSDEGYGYVLVVIDEFTSRSWALGLKHKSEVFGSLRSVIKEVETRMKGMRVNELDKH
jgi:hypothetical protein